VMVAQGVDNVRSELKRRGLAGGGATARYEVSHKYRKLDSADGRNHNKATIPRLEPTSPPIQARWPHLHLRPSSRTHRTSSPLSPRPLTAPNLQRRPKWTSCPTNTIPPYYTPSHQVHSSASTFWLVYIHGLVHCFPIRPSADSLRPTTRPVRRDSIPLSDSFRGPTSPRLPSKRH